MPEPDDIDPSESDQYLFLPIGYALSAGSIDFQSDLGEEAMVFLHLDGRWTGTDGEQDGPERFTITFPRDGVRAMIERFLDILDATEEAAPWGATPRRRPWGYDPGG